jgi:hypothetical protein
MSLSRSCRRILPRATAVAALLALGAGVSGCAQIGDTISPAFADPAKYDLYDCKQLDAERKALAGRIKDLQALMAKAETGVGGTVVAEAVYRNDYISARGQQKLVEENWQRNRCHDEPPAPAAATPPQIAPAPAANAKGKRKSG